MANQTPFGLALSFQRETARLGQRTVEQGLDAQRTMTEAFVRNAIGTGRAANRNATEATRQSAVAFAGLMDAMVPGGASARESVDAGFDSVADAQESTWRVFEETAEDGLETYAEMAESGMEVFAESMDAAVRTDRPAGQGSADAAVEYERQRSEDVAADRSERSEASVAETASESLSGTEPREVEPDAGEAPEGVTTGTDAETATEPETTREESPEVTGPTGGPDLTDLSGVGTAYADRLRAAGVESVEGLRDAEVTALSAETEISDERLANWQRQARHLLGEEE